MITRKPRPQGDAACPARKTRRGYATAAVGVAAVVLGAAACSSSGSSSATSGAGGEVTVHVGVTGGSDDATPFYAADKLGYFKDAGLNVDYTLIAGGDTAVSAALSSNSLDVALQSASQWVSDIAKKAVTGKIVGEYTDHNYDILARPGITSVTQLKGKVIGISSQNAGDQIYLEAVLQHYGISPSDVTFLAVGSPTTRLSTLEAGKIDAMEMPVTEVPASAGHYVMLTAAASPVPVVSQAVFANESFIDGNSAALKKFMAAIGRASTWVRGNQAAAVQYCELSQATAAACTTTIKDATNASVSGAYTWSSTWGLNVSGFETTLTAVAAVVPQAKGLTTSDILDTAIAGTKP